MEKRKKKLRKGFVKLPRTLPFDLLDAQETQLLIYIWLSADTRTGVWTGSAAQIKDSCPRSGSLRTIQRSLNRLTKTGFIRPFRTNHQRGNYKVLVHCYQVTNGCYSIKGKYVDARLTENLQSVIYVDSIDLRTVTCDPHDAGSSSMSVTGDAREPSACDTHGTEGATTSVMDDDLIKNTYTGGNPLDCPHEEDLPDYEEQFEELENCPGGKGLMDYSVEELEVLYRAYQDEISHQEQSFDHETLVAQSDNELSLIQFYAGDQMTGGNIHDDGMKTPPPPFPPNPLPLMAGQIE